MRKKSPRAKTRGIKDVKKNVRGKTNIKKNYNKDKTKKQIKKPIFLGRKLIFDKNKPSIKKSTADKAKYLRQFIDLPFTATKKFNKKQKELIDNKYDGLNGEQRHRMLHTLKRIKIDKDKKERFEVFEQFFILEKKYKIKGKTKKGLYLYLPVDKKSKITVTKYGWTERLKNRYSINYLFDDDEILIFTVEPEYVIEKIFEKFKKLINVFGDYNIKLLFKHGIDGRFEFEDIELLLKYIASIFDDDKDLEVEKPIIIGLTLIFHY